MRWVAGRSRSPPLRGGLLFALLDREFRPPAFDWEYVDVIASMQIRCAEAAVGAYVPRLNLTKERAFRNYAGAFEEPMSGQVALAHLLHTASRSDHGQKVIPGPVRGDLQGLRGIQFARRRVVVRSAPHSRPPW